MNRIFPFLVLLIFLSSCGKKYEIEGTSSVSSLDGKKLFLKVARDGNLVTVDSAEVIHGKFSMKGKIDSVEMVTLFMDEESIMPVVLEGGNIQISISNTGLSAKGTTLNDKFYAFIDKKNSIDDQLQELGRKEAKMILNGEDPLYIQELLTKENEQLIIEMNNHVKSFISQNYENVLGPSVFMMICSSMRNPVMTSPIEEILKDAPVSFKENKMVKSFIQQAHENMQLIKEHQMLESNSQQN